MLYELEPAQFARVRPLVTELAHHLSILAVIDGTVKGTIWVDDMAAPQSTFIRTPEGSYLGGAPTNTAFNQALAALLLTRTGISLKYHPPAWEETFPALLACKFARKYPRRYYTFQQLRIPNWRQQLPAGYEPALVDAQFLARQDLANMDEVTDRISEWTDYARDGFGFCLIHEGIIACRCIADCVSGNACELGIGTHPAYRGRGLATLTLAATVEYCLARGLPAIGWHCVASNWGSQRVAEKVGLVLTREYDNYANTPVAEHAGDLTPEEWRAHAAFFAAAQATLTRHSGLLGLRAAAAWAVAGDPDRALATLARLVDAGALLPEWRAELEQEWEWETLRADPRWPALLARLGQ